MLPPSILITFGLLRAVSCFHNVRRRHFLDRATDVVGDARIPVNTQSGPVMGIRTRRMVAFRGIPYAAPPVGDLRWRPPQPHPGWSKPLDAAWFGPMCPQALSQEDGGGAWRTLNVGQMDEDCLTLNVFVPVLQSPTARENKRPVLVYIHGGEFRYGGSNDRENNQPHFLEDDALMVTMNFRLGALGFLAADLLRPRSPGGGTGNYGMLDQRAAFQWVRNNIAAFGGNPESVTIMGESSGGTSVAFHLTSPNSFGLFQRAVLQSPGLRQVKTWPDTQVNFKYIVSVLATRGSPKCSIQPGMYEELPGAILGCDWAGTVYKPMREAQDEPLVESKRWCTDTPTCIGFTVNVTSGITSFADNAVPIAPADETVYGRLSPTTVFIKMGPLGKAALECLLAADAMTLAGIDNVPRDDSLDSDGWAPVVDGQDMSYSIEEAITREQVAPGVDVLIGTNSDETSSTMYLVDPITCNAKEEEFRQWASRFYGPEVGVEIVPHYGTVHTPILPCEDDSNTSSANATKQELPSLGSAMGGVGYWSTAAIRATTDSSFLCPVQALVNGLRAQRGGGRVFKYFFAHTPVYSKNFNTTGFLGAFHGAEIPFVFNDTFELTTLEEQVLATKMGCYWRSFVRSGDPNDDGCGTHWPQFLLEGSGQGVEEEASLLFNTDKIETVQFLGRKKCEIFEHWVDGRAQAGPHPAVLRMYAERDPEPVYVTYFSPLS